LKNLLIDWTAIPWWRLSTSTQMCASPNHRKVMKAESSQLTELATNVTFLIVVVTDGKFCFS